MSGHDHSHTDLRGEAGHDKSGMRVAVVAYAGLLGVVVVYVLIVAIQVWFYNEKNAEIEAVNREPNQAMRAYHERENERLRTARWVDKDKGVVAIPVDKAMELYATQHGNPPESDSN